jgi:hypothetical protein
MATRHPRPVAALALLTLAIIAAHARASSCAQFTLARFMPCSMRLWTSAPLVAASVGNVTMIRV